MSALTPEQIEKYRQRFILFYNKYTPGDDSKLQGGTAQNAIAAIEKLGVERTWNSLKKKYGAEDDAEFISSGFPSGFDVDSWQAAAAAAADRPPLPLAPAAVAAAPAHAAASASDNSYRARIARMYLTYTPDTVKTERELEKKVATQLDIYAGREEYGIQAMVMRYGPEPPGADANNLAAATATAPTMAAPLLPIPLLAASSPASVSPTPALPIPVPANATFSTTSVSGSTTFGVPARGGRCLNCGALEAANEQLHQQLARVTAECDALKRAFTKAQNATDIMAMENIEVVQQLQQVTAIVVAFAKKSGLQIPGKFLPILSSVTSNSDNNNNNNNNNSSASNNGMTPHATVASSPRPSVQNAVVVGGGFFEL